MTPLVDLIGFRDWRDIVRPDHRRRTCALEPAQELSISIEDVHKTQALNNLETP